MRKKLFTLMTLLLTAVTGAWAGTVTASYTFDGSATSGTNVTGTNCRVSYSGIGNSGSNVVTVSTESFYKFTSNDAYVTIKLDGGDSFAVGDELTIIGYMASTSAAKGYIIGSARGSGTDITQTGTKAKQTFTFTLTAASINADGTITLWRKDSNTFIRSFSVTHTSKDITSQTFSGVKVDGTALTEGAGYSVSSNTITLSDDILYLSTPDDITLTNHVVYDDETEEDKNVDVDFDGTVTAGYYIGTATIGATEYTVRVKKNTTPTLTATPTSITVTSAKAGTGKATITLTGANLDGAASVAFASAIEGLTVSPTTITVNEGAVSQEFTVSYKSDDDVAEAVVNLTFAVGSTSVVVPVTYSSTAAVTTISDVTGEISWDFSAAGTADITSPAQDDVIPLANASGYKAGFDYEYLAGKAQYFYYKSNSCYQGSVLKFHTTVPGVIKTEISNTGGSRPYRYLQVNGETTAYKSGSTTHVPTEGIYVPAGDVTLGGYIVNASDPQERSGDVVGASMLRFFNLYFEPLEDADAVTVSSAGYATVVLTKDAYFEATPEVTAYAAKAAGTKVTLTEVKAAPAGTPLVIKAAAGSYTLKKASTISPAAVSTDINDLMAGPVFDSDGTNYYVLGKEGSKVGFGLLASGVNLDATKAYIAASKFAGGDAPGFITIEGADDNSDITTGISAIEHSTLNIEHSEVYNLNGQRVSQPTKGLYIVNGKKVVVK